MLEIIVEFAKEKETPGTFRFKEIVPDGDTPVIQTLYLRKDKMGEDRPKKLRVTIEEIAE